MNQILTGDIPDNSVHCIITSPPYYGLRDYGTAKWEGGSAECDHVNPVKPSTTYKTSDEKRDEIAVGQFGNQYKDVCGKCGAVRIDSQIGLEKTPEEFIEKMVQVFRECRRILHPSGTLWLNLGDSYAGSHSDRTAAINPNSISYRAGHTEGGIEKSILADVGKPKDLLMMPFRVAMALQKDGWYLRSVMPWVKRNSMPESVTDRPATSMEYMFLLAKSQKYFFDMEAVRVKSSRPDLIGASRNVVAKRRIGTEFGGQDTQRNGVPYCSPSGRSFRNTDHFFNSWQGLYMEDDAWAFIVNPKGFSEAHFATFPEKLVEPCVKAGTSQKGCCPACGEPWVRVVEQNYIANPKGGYVPTQRFENDKSYVKQESKLLQTKTLGWKQNCKCPEQPPVPCVVFDPFIGAGTVAVVARKLGRHYLGIELNPKYVEMCRKRLGKVTIPLGLVVKGETIA